MLTEINYNALAGSKLEQLAVAKVERLYKNYSVVYLNGESQTTVWPGIIYYIYYYVYMFMIIQEGPLVGS